MVCIAQFSSCAGQREMVNGVSFVGGPNEIDEEQTNSVVEVNANWVSLMPFGFIRNIHAPEVRFNESGQWWGERKEGVAKTAKFFHDKGIKVMVKPQIWVWRGEFTGTIEMQNEEDWKLFETNYEQFILEYAQLATEIKAEMLCIGTELNKFVSTRPEFWKKLITNVRKVYAGKLTYAENWDAFAKVPFWEALDYVGVDAYFPLSEERTPSLERLKQGWQSHKEDIVEVYQKTKRPVLFTEYGYRSTDYAGKEPWDSSYEESNVNLDAQKNGLQALYEEFWGEDWFAGGFVWKWFDSHERSGGTKDTRFTPQNKPAEALIKQHYQSH